MYFLAVALSSESFVSSMFEYGVVSGILALCIVVVTAWGVWERKTNHRLQAQVHQNDKDNVVVLNELSSFLQSLIEHVNTHHGTVTKTVEDHARSVKDHVDARSNEIIAHLGNK